MTVSGLAMGPDGQPMPGGSIAAYLAGPDGRMLPRFLQTRAMAGLEGLSGIGSIKTDGTFRIDLIPNDYIIRGRYDSRAAPPEAVRYPRALMVSQPVTVGDTDIPNLILKFTYGAAVTGHVVFEGTPPPRIELFRVAVESGEQAPSSAPRRQRTEPLRWAESNPVLAGSKRSARTIGC